MRPESTALGDSEKYSNAAATRIHANWANTGNAAQSMAAPPNPKTATPASRRLHRIQSRRSQTSVTSATARFTRDALENDRTSAAASGAAPMNKARPDSGASLESPFGRNSATAIISRKNAHRFPSVLAS